MSHAEAFVVVEVLDALMNHLEETLEVVLNRGQNLMLDNKVGNKPVSFSSSEIFLNHVMKSQHEITSVKSTAELILVLLSLLGSPVVFMDSPAVPHQFPELLSVLLLAEQKVGCSLRWRLHEKLLQRYSCLARLLPGELLYQNFSPRIFIILTTNVRPRTHNTKHHDRLTR